MAATPVTQRHTPARQAARKATAALEDQLMGSPVRSEAEGHDDYTFGDPSPRSKGKTKVTYRSKGKSRTSPVRTSPPKRKPAPLRDTPKMSGRKRRFSPSKADEDGSDSEPLTPLTTCDWSTPIPFTPSKKSPAKKGADSPSSQKLSPVRANRFRMEGGSGTSSPSFSVVARGKQMVEEPWQAAKLGTFVWILVDKGARVIEAGDEDVNYSPDTMWWPARITSPSSGNVPLYISLIGEIAPRTPSAIEITSPSERNILSMLNANGQLRFNDTNFIISRAYDSLQSSPRKKKKRDLSDIESKWRRAVEDLVQQHDDNNDGLPQAGEAYSSFYGSLSFGSPRRKAKDKREHSPSNFDHDDDMEAATEPWVPPLCDPSLTVPGELVLAREKKESSIYWPAKIEDYIPPDKPSKPARYSIVFFDTVKAIILREQFFTLDQEGFGTCKLGQWESSYDEVLNDKESQPVGEDDTRSPSPPSAIPSSPEEFCSFSIPQQFAYVKSVLVAILNERYAPAKQRHADFIKGGAFRRAVAENAGARGMMSPADVEELQRCLLKWALRDERRAKRIVEDEISDDEVVIIKEVMKSGETVGRAADNGLTERKGPIEGTSLSPITSVDTESEVCILSSQPEMPPASSEPSSPGKNDSVQEPNLPINVDQTEDESGPLPNSSQPSTSPEKSDSVQELNLPVNVDHPEGESLSESLPDPSELPGNSDPVQEPTLPMNIDHPKDESLSGPLPNPLQPSASPGKSDAVEEPILPVDVGHPEDESFSGPLPNPLHPSTSPGKSDAVEEPILPMNVDHLEDESLSGPLLKPLQPLRSPGNSDSVQQPILPMNVDHPEDESLSGPLPKPLQPLTSPGNSDSVQESNLPLNDHTPEDEPVLSEHEKTATDGKDQEEPPLIIDACPRQRGCEAYEALSGVERIEYCSNVLLPEAILQILLWRSGQRSSIELLSDDEETNLHEIGVQQSEETDWVYDVVRLRDAKIRLLKKVASTLPLGGTRSRPKRVPVVRA